MDRKFDIIVAGELNVDIIFNQLDTMPFIGEERLAGRMTLALGSSSAIFASNIRTLGSSVAYVGRIGNDLYGNFIKDTLDAKAVDTTNIIKEEGSTTGATVVLNFGEDRAMVTYPGPMTVLKTIDIPDNLITSARHLHVSSIFLQTGLKPDLVELFTKAKKAGLTTSLDPQWDPNERWDLDLDSLLPVTDLFLPNAAEIKALTGKADLKDAIASLHTRKGLIVVKNGSDGSFCWDGRSLIHQPAYLNTQVVDCIGAGDSFDAGFIHRYLQMSQPADCLSYASLMGAVNTTANGGTAAFENIQMVRNIAAQQFNYHM